jgi:hypothetical protein
MRKLIFIILIACVGFVGCQAKEAEARGSKDPCKSFLGNVLNDCIAPVEQPEERLEAGVGLDIKLWENDKLIVDQENKLNLNSGAIDEGDFSTYTVFKPKMEKGLLQTVGDFISNLFNKE